MRFGETEVRTIATGLLSRYEWELPSDYTLTVRQMPTISPAGGLPVVVRERSPALAAAAA